MQGDGLSFRDLIGLQVWVVPPPVRVRPYRVLDARRGPKGAIVTLEGCATAADARELAGRWLLAAEADLPEPAAAAHDVLGFAVTDGRRGYLGVVTDVIITGANDVLVVDDGPFGQVLVPVIEQVIDYVDENAETITVDLLEGLIDEGGSS